MLLFFVTFFWLAPQDLKEQKLLFEDIAITAESNPIEKHNQALLDIAKQQLEKPYLERTLEVPGPEQLVIRLEGFDCFTLVESTLALHWTFASDDPSWERFEQYLTRIRYRQGNLEDYTSRLHYTSDWAFDNQQKGFLKDITRALGGAPYTKTINFMTQHRSAYKQLADASLFEKMAPIESQINIRNRYFIAKEDLANHEAGFQPGDIIAITTSIKGLDVSHVGLAVFQNKRLHMLHASSTNKVVEITQEPLADYLAGNKRQTGVMVFRPTTPAN